MLGVRPLLADVRHGSWGGAGPVTAVRLLQALLSTFVTRQVTQQYQPSYAENIQRRD